MSQNTNQPISTPTDGKFSSLWGPFTGPHDAALHLITFVDKSLHDLTTGIFWALNKDQLVPLRLPRYDQDGNGLSIVIEWNPVLILPPASPPQHAGFFSKVYNTLKQGFALYGEATMQNARMEVDGYQEIKKEIRSAINQSPLTRKILHEHGSDTTGVIFDAVAVGLTVTYGSGVIAGFALLGGLILLGTDGIIWALEISDKKEQATTFKENNFITISRWGALIISLPDGFSTLYKGITKTPDTLRMIRVSSEKQASSSYNTAKIAAQNAARTARIADDAQDAITASHAATYSKKYAEISERARQRAEKASRALQIAVMRTVRSEVIPTGLTMYGVDSMVNDALDPGNNDLIARHIRNFSFHAISAKKQ